MEELSSEYIIASVSQPELNQERNDFYCEEDKTATSSLDDNNDCQSVFSEISSFTHTSNDTETSLFTVHSRAYG